jgi:hypothetical protein
VAAVGVGEDLEPHGQEDEDDQAGGLQGSFSRLKRTRARPVSRSTAAAWALGGEGMNMGVPACGVGCFGPTAGALSRVERNVAYIGRFGHVSTAAE